METIKVGTSEEFGQMLGHGSEGEVFSYQGKYAIKVFPNYIWRHQPFSLKKLNRKMKKIEAMIGLEDPNVTFPLGFAEVPDDEKAYYMRQVTSNNPAEKAKTLESFKFELFDEEQEEILIKADAVLQRIHKMGIASGDIRDANIALQDDKEPIFVDIDNAIYEDYPFDIIPERAGALYQLYGGKATAFQDNDKLLFAMMALHLKTKDDRFNWGQDRDMIDEGVRRLHATGEAKEVLECIFSDALDKPYIGKVFKKI